MRAIIKANLKQQYERTMREAYAFARKCAISGSPIAVLDCGAGDGHELVATFNSRTTDPGFRYQGIEWSEAEVCLGHEKGLDIIKSDLNCTLPLADDSRDCIIAYSVLEHLLKPCGFIAECHRVLRPGGALVILTPNIATWFTIAQVLMGGMPSSGPHPDSNWLVASSESVRVSRIQRDDLATDTPKHRHLVVFSFKVLSRFLVGTGFAIEESRGFGYYPFPRRLQRMLERLDPGRCHQMVFLARKTSTQSFRPTSAGEVSSRGNHPHQ